MIRAALLALLLAIALGTVHLLRPDSGEVDLPANPAAPIALIDHAHHPLTPTDPIVERLRRRGVLVALANSWNPRMVRRARLLIVPPSFAPLTANQIEQITVLMKEGGVVLVAGGPSKSQLAWLADFGVRISTRPLGNGTGQPPTADFSEGWALELSGRARALVRLRRQPVVAETPVGKGRLVVIADPRLLALSNERNAQFLERVVGLVR